MPPSARPCLSPQKSMAMPSGLRFFSRRQPWRASQMRMVVGSSPIGLTPPSGFGNSTVRTSALHFLQLPLRSHSSKMSMNGIIQQLLDGARGDVMNPDPRARWGALCRAADNVHLPRQFAEMEARLLSDTAALPWVVVGSADLPPASPLRGLVLDRHLVGCGRDLAREQRACKDAKRFNAIGPIVYPYSSSSGASGISSSRPLLNCRAADPSADTFHRSVCCSGWRTSSADKVDTRPKNFLPTSLLFVSQTVFHFLRFLARHRGQRSTLCRRPGCDCCLEAGIPPSNGCSFFIAQ